MQSFNRDGTIDGAVERTSYLGAAVEYEIAIGDERVQATENDPLRALLYPSGTPVRIGLSAEPLYLLPHA